MSIVGRIAGRLGGLLDEVALTERQHELLDAATRAVEAGDGVSAERLASAVERERPGLFRTALLLGLSRELVGDLRGASVWLARARQYRDTAPVRVALARVAAALGDEAAAREHLDQALALAGNAADRLDALLALARLLEHSGDPSRAVAPLRLALRVDPNDNGVRQRLASALLVGGDAAGALEALGDLTRPGLPPELLRVAGDIFLVGDLPERSADAERVLRALVDAVPGDLGGVEKLAALFRRQGRVAEAAPLLQQALTNAPIDAQARLHRELAACYRAADDAARALDSLRAAMALDDDDPVARCELVELALELGLLQEARAAAGPLADRVDGSREARTLVGRVALASGEIDRAAELLLPLRAAGMSHAELHALGELALARGDSLEALTLLREADALVPGRRMVRDALHRALATRAPRLPELTADAAEPPVEQIARWIGVVAATVADVAVLDGLAAPLLQIARQLEQPLSLAVMGEFNAGKSTFINAWLGEPMLAAGVLPTTSHVNVVRWGPRRVARLRGRDGVERELDFAEAARVVRREPDTIASLEFWFPHPDLRAVHFWDTPGFNAPDPEHERRAEEALHSATAVLWLLDAHQALTSTEFGRIEQIERSAERLIVVVNKIDRLDGDASALDAVLSHVRTHVGDRCAGIFPVAASLALQARQCEPMDGDGLKLARWPELEEAVRRRVLARAGRLKAIEAARALDAVLADAIARASVLRERVDAQRAELAQMRVGLDATVARLDVDVIDAMRSAALRGVLELRSRVLLDARELCSTGDGILGRRRLQPVDAGFVLQRVPRYAGDVVRGAVAPLRAHLRSQHVAVVEACERAAQVAGPPESRTVQRRIESWLAQIVLWDELFVERVVEAVERSVLDRSALIGERVLVEATERSLAGLDGAPLLVDLLPAPDDAWAGAVEYLALEYLAGLGRLLEQAARDVELLAIDLDQRIIRPFVQAREGLALWNPEGEAPAKDPDAE